MQGVEVSSFRVITLGVLWKQRRGCRARFESGEAAALRNSLYYFLQ